MSESESAPQAVYLNSWKEGQRFGGGGRVDVDFMHSGVGYWKSPHSVLLSFQVERYYVEFSNEQMNQMIKSICIYLFITHIACMYKPPLPSR